LRVCIASVGQCSFAVNPGALSQIQVCDMSIASYSTRKEIYESPATPHHVLAWSRSCCSAIGRDPRIVFVDGSYRQRSTSKWRSGLAERDGVSELQTLPPPALKFGGVVKPSAVDSKPWWPPRIVPPKGAPNVLLIMTDDAGYGVSGTFGGVIPTPALDRIAKMGLRYTQFHSTALCSPTRAALIAGRNHHSVGA
jgi:hypothetical protein